MASDHFAELIFSFVFFSSSLQFFIVKIQVYRQTNHYSPASGVWPSWRSDKTKVHSSLHVCYFQCPWHHFCISFKFIFSALQVNCITSAISMQVYCIYLHFFSLLYIFFILHFLCIFISILQFHCIPFAGKHTSCTYYCILLLFHELIACHYLYMNFCNALQFIASMHYVLHFLNFWNFFMLVSAFKCKFIVFLSL